MNFFRNLFMKMGAGFRRFMMGRYGSDKLNLVLLGISVLFSLIASFIPQNIVKLILVAISYSLMIWAIYRMLSRKTYFTLCFSLFLHFNNQRAHLYCLRPGSKDCQCPHNTLPLQYWYLYCSNKLYIITYNSSIPLATVYRCPQYLLLSQ